MRSSRPVNLDLFAFAFPITAVVSIIHRITGVALFFGLPLLLWLLDASLTSSTGFNLVGDLLALPLGRLLLWVYLVALLFHLVAGVKHLCMDLGFFETKESAPIASKVVIAVALVLIALTGVWLW